jgi:hypothetical protein
MAERQHISHAVTWSITVIALPLIYVLSVYPLITMVMYKDPTGEHLPSWLERYAKPARIVESRLLPRKLMVGYEEWWWQLTGLQWKPGASRPHSG